MDSVSQMALGAAVTVAAMGRRTALWRAAACGAVAGTLPDLDVFIDHGDAIRNMVLHRAETHSLFWLTLFSLPFAAAVARVQGQWLLWPRWWLALWLALVTHPLLDAMTVYGTRIALPFSDRPVAVGSIFIIDPLYTLPLLAGVGLALASQRLSANAVGLAVSSAYLGWGALAQQHVERIARESLAAQGVAAERVLVTPTAFNSIAWRVLAMNGDHYLEGFVSLLDAQPGMRFDRFPSGNGLRPQVQGIEGFRRVVDFSRGFYALRDDGRRVIVSDLRMGQEPSYTFSFAIAEHGSALRPLTPPEPVGSRPDLGRALPWLARRIAGDPAPPPR